MRVEDAYDLIDTHGADENRWPLEHVADLNDLIANNAQFRDYVQEMRDLDAALSAWSDDAREDGVDNGEEREEPPAKNAGGNEEPEEELDGEDQESDEQNAEDENEEPQDQPGPGGQQEEQSDEGVEDDKLDGTAGAGAPLDFDLSQVKDMDDLLGESLGEMLFNGFDSTRQIDFTRRFDVIAPYDDSDRDLGEPDVAGIEREVATMTNAMQRELQRLIVARSASYLTPGFRSGRINPAALHRVPAGRDDVFRRKTEAKTNKVAMSLVIDNSGSMYGQKVEVAMKAAWAFAETLERLKIACDVVGFTDTGFPYGTDINALYNEIQEMIRQTGCDPHAVRQVPFWMPIFKGFDEKFGPATKRRMAHQIKYQRGMVANNDALALDYAGRRLLARPETRKIMIVFSDGQPAANGVSGGILNRTVVDNIAKLERSGVEVIGVGIMSQAVRSFYRKNYVLNNVADLPTFVMRELKALLAPH